MRKYQRGCVEIENYLNLLHCYWVFEKILFTLYFYVLAKTLQNGITFLQKLTTGFKNHTRNWNNFRQAVASPKSWNFMGVYLKNTFFQLKYYIQRIYLTLLSTTSVKVQQITYVIFDIYHKSFFTAQLLYFFLAQTLHTLYKSPSKCKLLDVPLFRLKFTKFLMPCVK